MFIKKLLNITKSFIDSVKMKELGLDEAYDPKKTITHEYHYFFDNQKIIHSLSTENPSNPNDVSDNTQEKLLTAFQKLLDMIK